MKEPILAERGSGILLHPTCLPGPYGLGDLGPAAYAWVDALARAGQDWWQILPLGPTGYGDSPYQCFSAFAGNVYLLSPEALLQDGLLNPADIPPLNFPAHRVDYGPVIEFKQALLRRAWENFRAGAAAHLRVPFDTFCAETYSWLDEFALFMALKETHAGAVWTAWEPELAAREPQALTQARDRLAPSVGLYQFGQFLFFHQWSALRAYAHEKKIRFLGDAPIFVAHDSADVWANPDLFYLDAGGRPTLVAGVPPDYFSATGQLWGNPLYNWKRLKETGYAWWIERLRAVLQMVDAVRLDHFRGFEAYWEVPADHTTAEVGRWVKGPGATLFTALQSVFDHLPIIAEDLGVITPEVEKLRDRFHLPGMKVLQFAWGDTGRNPFLPHNYTSANCVVYTGTHDNDTTRGWYQSTSEKERDFFRRYTGRDGHDISWDFIRLAWASVAQLAVAPLQDVLGLDSSARMNWPGSASGNWTWRFTADQLTDPVLDRLSELTGLYSRW